MITTTSRATLAPPPARGTIYYDGACNLCTAGAARFGPMLRRRGFELAPLQSPDAAARLRLANAELLDEVRLLTPEGHVRGGADAILHVARHVWWATPLWAISFVPGVTPLMRYAYRRLVPYRYCVAGRCGQPSPLVTWAPPVLLILGALTLHAHVSPWAFMWIMAASIFFSAKWLTWRRAPVLLRSGRSRSIAYLFAWPGMDAIEFLRRDVRVVFPAAREVVWTVAKMAVGAALIWSAARFVLPRDALLAGWTGMIGLILLLHFGTFHLIALLWQRAGVDARPIMDRAIASTSLAEFWGRRWNRGFSDLVRRLVFTPARRRFGAVGALVATFALSGLLHELVITLPARGGWGGPTLYFLIQAIALLLERTRVARRVGLGRGAVGWAFVALTTVAPLPLLFPPPFIERVVLPFMYAIGAFREVSMTSINRADLIFIAGLLHFGILFASALTPRVLDWRRELGNLEPLTRHLVWLHGAFIVLTIVGFGVIATCNALALASGSPLARTVCAFIAGFWLARLGIQFFVFDARPYLSSLFLKLGYHGLTVVFSILVLVFSWSAVAPA